MTETIIFREALNSSKIVFTHWVFRPWSAKTGTTQVPNLRGKANKDAWFVGYTSDYVIAIHVGFDQTDRTHYISTTGGSEPAKLFHDVMTQVYE